MTVRLVLTALCATSLGARGMRVPRFEPPNLQQAPGAPSRHPSASALEQQIEQSLAQGSTARARKLLDELLRSPRVTADQLLRVGGAFAERGFYPEAALAFARCAQDHPSVFEAHYDLALAQLAAGQSRDALATIQAAPPSTGNAMTARLYLRGKIEASLGQSVDAERDLAAAFNHNPAEENYALDLGLFYVHSHEYIPAARVFEAGVRYHPQSPPLLLGLALAQFLGGRAAACSATCRKLMEVEPAFWPARLLLSFTLYVTGELDEAERVAAAGLRFARSGPYLYYFDAFLLVKLHSSRYDRISKELAVAEQGITNCGLCYLAAGKAHQAQGDRRAAIKDFETSVRLTPGLADAWYHLAALYTRAGDSSQAAHARQQFERLKARPESHEGPMLRQLFLQTLGKQS